MKSLLLILLFVVSFSAQSQKGLDYFSTKVEEGIKPTESNIHIFYTDSRRAITYFVPRIKDYQYSNEMFDKLGFSMIANTTFRHCKKNLIVTRKYYQNVINIKIEWHSDEVKNYTHLMYCE